MSNIKEKNDDLEGFIDFAEEEDKNDEIEFIVDESGETIVKIPEEEVKNIYRQPKQVVRDLKRNIMEKDILYKEKSPSARHTGLKPLRIAILTLINESSKIAEKSRLMFMGLTLYEIQKAMKPCNVSNHTIKDNLRKLVDLGLIQKKNAVISGNTNKTVFYDVKLNSFPCKDGAYILWDKDFRSRGLYVISCPKYPFCSLKKEDCRILDHLIKLARVLPKHIQNYGVEIEDVDIEFPAQIDAEKNDKEQSITMLSKQRPKKYYRESEAEEKESITNRIVELRKDEENPKSFKECIEIILHEFEIGIETGDIYTILKNIPSSQKKNINASEVIQKQQKSFELKSFRELDKERKKEVEDKVVEILSGDFPKSWSECADIVRDELKVKINEYNISTILRSV